MATPILLSDANANFIPRLGQPYNIHVRDYQLGEHATIEALSGWAFGETELKEVLETGLVFLRFFEFQPPICLFHAGITEFEDQNIIYRHPDCLDLPSFTREIHLQGEYSERALVQPFVQKVLLCAVRDENQRRELLRRDATIWS